MARCWVLACAVAGTALALAVSAMALAVSALALAAATLRDVKTNSRRVHHAAKVFISRLGELRSIQQAWITQRARSG